MNMTGWSEEMMKNWVKAQQKYWENLTAASGMTQDQKTAFELPDWAAGMEKWWELVSPQVPVQATHVMQRVFDMGKAYAHMAESAFAGSSTTGGEANVLEGWVNAMEKAFKDWTEQAEKYQGLYAPVGIGGNPMENWQRLMESAGLQGGGNMQEMPIPVSPGQWQEQMQKLFGVNAKIPPENMQLLQQLTERYQKAMQTYLGAFSMQGLASVDALRERMQQLGRDGYSIDSLRELYDLWVDVSEEVYGRFAMSDQYQNIYGELVNAFVALKGGMDAVLETQLKAMRIVTPGDLDAVFTQQEEQVHNHQALKDLVDDLQSRVKALEESHAELAAAGSSVPGSETAPVSPPVQKSQEDVMPAATAPDDLTKIKGLGPRLQEKLIDAGIQTFSQLAALSAEQAEALDRQLDARGRLVREDWVGQASRFV